MSADIDLDFRPDTYFRAQSLERELLARVKGSALRERLRRLFEQGRHAEAIELAETFGLVPEGIRALEALHPRFMGGNYLPGRARGEVEIARIDIDSTTRDVTSVYARPGNGVILYRVVDEYGGSTLQGRSRARSTRPLTLGRLADFFLAAWPLVEVLESNFDDDLDEALRFFTASSDFYPDFDLLCRRRACEQFGSGER